MKFPSMPMKGKPVEQTVTEIIQYLRASRVTGMVGGRVQETPNGTTLVVVPGKSVPGVASTPAVGPFKLSARNDAGTIKWTVSSTKSSVTNGTNGDAYSLGSAGTDWVVTAPKKFDVEHSLSAPATKFVVLEAPIASSPLGVTASDWTLAAVDEADAEEVGIDSGPPVIQDKIRLLIGKITVDTATDPDSVTVSQAVISQQRTTNGIFNGLEVLVFEPCGINIDDL